MNHALLTGSYEFTIDQKNRLPIASEFRRAINSERDGDAYFILVGINGRLWLYPDRYYTALLSQRPGPELLPELETLEFDHMYFGSAYRRAVDDQGRILIPEKLLKRTKTERDVSLVGSLDHLELWNRAEWDAREEDLDSRRPTVATAGRRLRPPGEEQKSAQTLVVEPSANQGRD